MSNRVPNNPDEQPTIKMVVVQTPLGLLKLALPVTPDPDGQDPLQVAMGTFQAAVDGGAEDPLNETLVLLKRMSDEGSTQPLIIGLAILKQMADNGMLPPMRELIEGTGISQAFVNNALEEVTPRRRGIFGKLDQIHLN